MLQQKNENLDLEMDEFNEIKNIYKSENKLYSEYNLKLISYLN